MTVVNEEEMTVVKVDGGNGGNGGNGEGGEKVVVMIITNE